MTLVTAVAGRPMGKGLSKVLKYGAQVVGSPQMQTVLYGNANMGSLSWGEVQVTGQAVTHSAPSFPITFGTHTSTSLQPLAFIPPEHFT